MPIKKVLRSEKPTCFGYSWEIQDESLLAVLVGKLLLGQHRHVNKIISYNDKVKKLQSSNETIDNLINKLNNVSHDTLRYHRDGWIFQAISWIAAKKINNRSLMAAPHSQPADKGFDNLIIDLDEDSTSIRSIIICEDKATENARQTITTKVWPEFKMFEDGLRDNELLGDVTILLERNQPTLKFDIDDYLENIFIRDKKNYKISITTDKIDDSDHRQKIFKGFDNKISGELDRRRADSIYFSQLRSWMDNFANEVRTYLRSCRNV